MEFVLQFVAGDDGVAVGFRQFDNVVEVVHTAPPTNNSSPKHSVWNQAKIATRSLLEAKETAIKVSKANAAK
jgi:hypothetical protein